MKITKNKITGIFFISDEFYNSFKDVIKGHTLGNLPKKKPIMSASEAITLMMLFHYGCFKNMKHFYCYVT